MASLLMFSSRERERERGRGREKETMIGIMSESVRLVYTTCHANLREKERNSQMDTNDH